MVRPRSARMQTLYLLAKKKTEAGRGIHAALVEKQLRQRGSLEELLECRRVQMHEMSLAKPRSAVALKNSLRFQDDLDSALQQQESLIRQLECQIGSQLTENQKLYSRQQGIASLKDKIVLEEHHEEQRQEAKRLDEFVSARFREN